jgi:hypothetical protein
MFWRCFLYLTIIIIFILCPNDKHLNSFEKKKFQDVHIFKSFYKKLFTWTENTFETCNLIHFNNGVLKIFLNKIIIFFILCLNENKIKFLLCFFPRFWHTMFFKKEKSTTLTKSTFKFFYLIHFSTMFWIKISIQII